jgi:carboxylesterase type B
LRFTAPAPPLHNRSAGVQNGSYGNACPQAYPTWLYNFFRTTSPELLSVIPKYPGSEDCLFLDVLTPERVLQTAIQNRDSPAHPGAHVIVWIYGGGYYIGDKSLGTEGYDPVGLLDQTQQDVIIVAFNYRVGGYAFHLPAGNSSNH